MGIKKKRVKKDMMGMVITSSKLREDIDTNSITEELIEFYTKQGLGYVFEEYDDEPKSKVKSETKRKTSKKKNDKDN